MAGLGLVSLLLIVFASLVAPDLFTASAAPRSAATTVAADAGAAVHLVKAGETLSAIAARHRVTVASLVAANRLASANVRLRIGQRLTIPGPAPAVARVRRALPAVTTRRPAAPPRTLVLALPDFSELAPLFAWPVDGQVSSKFGRRRMGWHRGIDIKADLGTPVAAAATGVVVASTYQTRYGRVVKIEHPNGFMTVYAHNDQNLVEAGDRVMLGQPIAAVGRTGRATAHHLHFEIRQTGLAYNPLYMLPLPPRVMLIEETDEEDHDDADE
jgi:murein DD-endopeptidase MepM/ murein hydrolase activator NlpD